MRKIILGCMLVLSCTLLQAQKQQSVLVLYENDVHCYAEGYPVMAGLADSLRAKGNNVIIVSNGDFIFGNTLGVASRGEYIVRLMNTVGYDYVTLGNHEFDYGIPRLMELQEKLNARMLCCNFVNKKYNRVMASGDIRTIGGQKIGFVGVTTPYALTSSTPTNFMDSTGKIAYSFCQDNIAEIVQFVVDSLHHAGAETIILLSHLGDSEGETNSTHLVKQTTGIDVVLDGHDHHTISQRWIPNKDQMPVLLSSTGEHLNNIGILTITPFEGMRPIISTQLLQTYPLRLSGCVNWIVEDTLNRIEKQYNSLSKQTVGWTEFPLTAFDEEGMRLARMEETNLGDLVSDAYRIIGGAQIGWVNGGSLRTNLNKGPITLHELLSILPFRNRIIVVDVPGQDILDALEMGTRAYPEAIGGFPQVSGLTYELRRATKTSVVTDSNSIFDHVGRRRRVQNVQIITPNGPEPLDPEKHYTIASTDYVLNKKGDGIVLPHARIIKEDIGYEVDVLKEYIEKTGGLIGKEYMKTQNRIIIH